MLEQAERNIKMLPDTEGICIDRADWLRLYNRHADDGVTWLDGKPARSLFRSWIALMDKLGPQMHKADKVIFSNLLSVRLETAKELDGIYTEFGYNGNVLNGSALLPPCASPWSAGRLTKHRRSPIQMPSCTDISICAVSRPLLIRETTTAYSCSARASARTLPSA